MTVSAFVALHTASDLAILANVAAVAAGGPRHVLVRTNGTKIAEYLARISAISTSGASALIGSLVVTVSMMTGGCKFAGSSSSVFLVVALWTVGAPSGPGSVTECARLALDTLS